MNTNNAGISENRTAHRPIYNISPFTLLDYPGKTACILWFSGCNMRCSYCYNPEIVFGESRVSYQEALRFLQKRRGLLDGVVLSGGECSRAKGMPGFLEEVKALGFLIKMDTNGSRPEVIREWCLRNLLDYVALDFKAPKNKFREITGSKLYSRFFETLSFLPESGIEFEIRTTIHSELIQQADLEEMVGTLRELNYQGKWHLQNFRNGVPTLKLLADSRQNYLDIQAPAQTFEIEYR